jgi:lysozyme family protein
MTIYTEAFDAAVDKAMMYEVGGFWKLTPDVLAGLCDTPARQKGTGYVNDPVDPGGETKFGVAKNANPSLDIKAMTWEDAKAVYFNKYWLTAKCDKLPSRLAKLHFDGAINHGPKKAGMFLQKAVQATIDEIQICNTICDLRAQFYNDIVSAKPTQVKYLKGWLRRVEEMRTFVTS